MKPCKYCVQSQYLNQTEMLCKLTGAIVLRDDSCEAWMRATGADDE